MGRDTSVSQNSALNVAGALVSEWAGYSAKLARNLRVSGTFRCAIAWGFRQRKQGDARMKIVKAVAAAALLACGATFAFATVQNGHR
jgi:hypothetical protein